MSNSVREVQITLTLDTQQASENLALATLQRWYQRAEILNRKNDDFDFFRLRLHKDIYLSGLLLCLLEPRLVKFLAQHLQQHNLTAEFLQQSLEEHQLTLSNEAQLANQPGQFAPDELAAHIADKLYALLNAQDKSMGLNEQSGELHAQVSMLAQRLQEQSHLLQQQAQQLDQMARVDGEDMPDLTASPAQAAQASGDRTLHNISETAARVRKIREKGVF